MMVDKSSEQVLRGLSLLLGWIYTISWSLSFYPQPLLNWRRRSTSGTTFDFMFLNVIGFSCYTISTASLLYSPVIRSQYAVRHPVSLEPTTQFNDLAFGVHALFWATVTYSQYFERIWGFEIPASQRLSRPVAAIAVCCAVMVVFVFGIVVVENGFENQDATTWAWIDMIWCIGSVKLIVTLVKYIPQIYLNYQRKSTDGWSIGTILFDVNGGVLSLVQLIIDSSLQTDWSGLVGNSTKLGLSLITILFDLIQLAQHYILYRHSHENGKDVSNSDDDDGNAGSHKNRTAEHTPLLGAT